MVSLFDKGHVLAPEVWIPPQVLLIFPSHSIMISMKFVVFACLSWIFGVAANASLPTVDLGYEVHRAISFNVRLIPDGHLPNHLTEVIAGNLTNLQL